MALQKVLFLSCVPRGITDDCVFRGAIGLFPTPGVECSHPSVNFEPTLNLICGCGQLIYQLVFAMCYVFGNSERCRCALMPASTGYAFFEVLFVKAPCLPLALP